MGLQIFLDADIKFSSMESESKILLPLAVRHPEIASVSQVQICVNN